MRTRVPSARSNAPGLNLLRLQWANTFNAFYENDLPAGSRDEVNYSDLVFRAAVTLNDARNPSGQAQDFSVVLTDGVGHSATTKVSTWSNALYYPPLNANRGRQG